jgi:hypothetical protein
MPAEIDKLEAMRSFRFPATLFRDIAPKVVKEYRIMRGSIFAAGHRAMTHVLPFQHQGHCVVDCQAADLGVCG